MILLLSLLSMAPQYTQSEETMQDVIIRTFDGLLSENSVELFPDEREYRLGIFSLSCFTSPNFSPDLHDSICDGVGIDGIYTSEELDRMNGAVLEEEIEEVESGVIKRQVGAVPSSYDVRDHVIVNQPIHQGVCGNCYIHSFISALEIAYYKDTGGKVAKFSHQELTDCYHRGCTGGDYRALANWVAIVNHLGDHKSYGAYLSQHISRQFACKAPVTPDALTGIKIVGFKKVTPATLDFYVYTYGSVMTCLAWKDSNTNNCGKIQGMKQGDKTVFEGTSVPGGCDHAVLIVGYTPDHYIVKNSHGVGWGDKGYFRIKRGTNACGIEDDMAVLITERRPAEEKKLAPNGCPPDKPNYCSISQSCTSSTNCVQPDRDTTFRVKRAGDTWGFLQGKPDVNSCEDNIPSFHCERLMYKCKTSSIFKTTHCPKTCGNCDTITQDTPDPRVCRDVSSLCDKINPVICNHVSSVRKSCPLMCNTCTLVSDKLKVLYKPAQPHGPCNKPDIAHGKVLNAGKMIRHGNILIVQCDPGYVLTGEDVTCVIEDVFSPDSRLLPQCIKVGKEQLSGEGAEYKGTKSVSLSGKRCQSWSEEVYRGIVPVRPELADNYLNGNHNFCRNKHGVEAVPYCIVLDPKDPSGSGKPEFCFHAPGCDSCNSPNLIPDEDSSCPDYASGGECAYSTVRLKNLPEYRWKYCRESCCKAAGC